MRLTGGQGEGGESQGSRVGELAVEDGERRLATVLGVSCRREMNVGGGGQPPEGAQKSWGALGPAVPVLLTSRRNVPVHRKGRRVSNLGTS